MKSNNKLRFKSLVRSLLFLFELCITILYDCVSEIYNEIFISHGSDSEKTSSFFNSIELFCSPFIEADSIDKCFSVLLDRNSDLISA